MAAALLAHGAKDEGFKGSRDMVVEETYVHNLTTSFPYEQIL